MIKTTVYTDQVICLLGPSDSQLPRIQPPEESYYVNRRVFPQLSPQDIPQPDGPIYRG